MHDRRDTGRGTTVAVEDVISDEILADDLVDAAYLREVFREPRRYLPPPTRRRKRRDPKPPREPESPVARRAKLIALIIATALLAGAVAAAATIADEPSSPDSMPAERPVVSGAAALGGFVLPARSTTPAERPSPTTDTAAEATTDQRAVAEPVERTPDPTPSGDGTPTTRSLEASDTTPAGEPPGGLATVREFYTLMADSPSDALALLDPALASDGGEGLLRSWSGMDVVRVDELREEADGKVRAVVTMIPHDGEPLRVTQLLRLTEGPGSLISDATLLSTDRD